MACRSKFFFVFGVVSLLAASAAVPALQAANMKPVYAQIKSALASGNTVQRATAVRQIAAVLRQGTHYDCPTRLCYRWLLGCPLHIIPVTGQSKQILTFCSDGSFAL